MLFSALAIAWIFGIFLSGYLAPNILVFILAIFFGVLTLFIYWLRTPDLRTNNRVLVVFLKVMLCVAVFLGGNGCYRLYESHMMEKATAFCREHPATLQGIVISDVSSYDGTQYFYLKTDHRLKVRVKVQTREEILPGHRITLEAPTLTVVNPRNTYLQSTRKFLGNGAFLSATFPYDATVQINGVANYLLYGGKLLRNVTQEWFHALFSPKVSGFLTALISSDKSGISTELYDDFVTTGTVHIVVVSGMHFNYLMGALLWLFSFFVPARRKRLILSGIVLAVFVCYTGATLPVLRSFCMLMITFFCDLFYWKKATAKHILLGMVCLFICVSPTLIFNPSFLLSFGAALGLAAFSQPLDQILAFLRIRWLRSYLVTYLSVQVFTLPMILLYFARMPLASVFVNFLVGPLVAPILILAAVTLCTSRIPLLGTLIVRITAMLSSLFLIIVTQLAKLPLKVQVSLTDRTCLWLLAGSMMLLAATECKTQAKKAVFQILTVFSLVSAIAAASVLPSKPQVFVTFFGASNTNSAAIITENQRLILSANAKDLLYGQSTGAYRRTSPIELLILTDVSDTEFVAKFLQEYSVKQVLVPEEFRNEMPQAENVFFVNRSITAEVDGIQLHLYCDNDSIYETQLNYGGQQLSFTQDVSHLTEELLHHPEKNWVFNFRRTSQTARNLPQLHTLGKLYSKKDWHPDAVLYHNDSMIRIDRRGICLIGAMEQEP